MQAVRFIKIATVALIAVAASAGAGWAFDEKPFDAKAFAAAQDAGKPILVDAFAPWCPVCKAQQQVLGELKQNAKYDAVTVFKIDYDNQPDALKSFDVRKQSTLDRLQRQSRNRPHRRRYEAGFDHGADRLGAELAAGSREMLLGSALFALLAGILSTLSPCVLPLLPIILVSAVSEHRLGPLALASGLALSFVTVGMFIATIGYGIGLDAGFFRIIAATMLVALGIILLVPQLQTQIAAAASPISGWTEERFGGIETAGLSGQFALGLLLGAVWSPCVGPTLGAASVLAAQGQDLAEVALVMLAFGLGAALPLLLLGLLSRDTLMRWRGRLLDAGKGGKLVLGGLLVVIGVMILSGLDKRIEAALVEASPAWLTEITTRF